MLNRTMLSIAAALIIALCGSALGMPSQNIPLSTVDNGARGFLDCGSPIPITLGTLFTVIGGDNTGAINNVNSYSCMYWAMQGGEVVYALTLTEDMTVGIQLGSDCDLGIFLLESCDESAACLGYSDQFVGGQVEEFWADLSAGTYYLVVDGFGVGEGCPYTLYFTPIPELWGTDRCDDSELVCLEPTSEPRTISGNNYFGNQFYVDYMVSPGGTCLPGGTNDGSDVVYVLAMDAGDYISASVDIPYGFIWLTDDCMSSSCIVGDGGMPAPPSILYAHSGPLTLFYLIIASNNWGVENEYQLTYTHNGTCEHPVANEDKAWGDVKSMYR